MDLVIELKEKITQLAHDKSALNKTIDILKTEASDVVRKSESELFELKEENKRLCGTITNILAMKQKCLLLEAKCDSRQLQIVELE